jgi:microcystin-dependent protein
MGCPYSGEIRMFGGNFPPNGWAFCNGQLMPISENDALFALIGTTYGGDGESTFALPDLQGRAPIHQGTGPGLGAYTIGEKAGVESVTLTTQQIPTHNHAWLASTGGGTSNTPANNISASPPTVKLYRTGTPSDPMSATIIQPAGGSQPHENLQPYLTISFIISLFGIFPQQT